MSRKFSLISVNDIFCFCVLVSEDDCVGHNCLNGATCVDQHLNYGCNCATGFEGDRCQSKNDHRT